MNRLKGTQPSVSDPSKEWVVIKSSADCAGTLLLSARETAKLRLASDMEKVRVSVSPVFARESP